ncbi:MAG TPA: DUF6624 domain-containing protein [Pyrinomonadaceae bacterium]|jgi:hypothetical protein
MKIRKAFFREFYFKKFLSAVMFFICFQAIATAQTRTYDIAAYDAHQAYQAKNYRKAAEYQMEAGRLKGNDEGFYLTAALWYVVQGDQNNAFKALEAAAGAGLVDVLKVTSNPEFESLTADTRWKSLASKIETNQRAYAATLKAPELRQKILQMWANDQRARTLWVKKQRELQVPWNSDLLAEEYNRIYEIDAYNTKTIKTIVEKYGWTTIPRVGRDGAYAAWALVQHSDDVVFQEKCLALMKTALQRKEINPEQYAELYDRTQRNKYEKQLYGMAVCSGNQLCPIFNEGNLEQRRKEIGLEPTAVSARLEGIIYRPITISEAKKRDALDKAQAQDLVKQSQRAFGEGKYEESKHLFNKALRYFGDVGAKQIYDAAIRFASLKEDVETYRQSAFSYLKILFNRGKLTKQRLEHEKAFVSLQTDKRWSDLISKF